jgi:DNA polymerase
MGDEAEARIAHMQQIPRRIYQEMREESKRDLLASIYEEYREDPKFSHLRAGALGLVPGEGSRKPDILIVGEAPGATEDNERRPFCGLSGRALRSLLRDCAELPEDSYFITNVVKYFPNDKRRVRTPSVKEIRDSVPYLRREWKALGGPRIVVAVGGSALSALRPDLTGITRWAGTRAAIGNGSGSLFPMLHPAYILRQRNPEEKVRLQAKAERDWTELGRWYREEFKP